MKLNWNGWEDWNLLYIRAIPDGNCLFHCLLYILYDNYKKSTIIDKLKYVKLLRTSLAKKLYQPINQPNEETNKETNEEINKETTPKHIKTNYELLGNGNYNQFNIESGLNEFSIETMYNNISNGGVYIGYGYLEHISRQLETDIWILWKNKQTVYPFIKDEIYYNNNKSVVLLYDDIINHFDIIGLYENNSIVTLFNYNHPFIVYIKSQYNITIS